MATKKTNFGKVQANVQGYTVRNVPKFSGTGINRSMTTSSLGVFRGKTPLKDGFKNKAEAVTYIEQNLLN
jgi:hypothetical protein